MHVELLDLYNIHSYCGGVIKCLSDGFGPITVGEDKAAAILLNKIQSGHFIVVTIEEGEVVATATGFVEQKLIHAGVEKYKAKKGGSRVMHIEDVATRTDQRGNGYGAASMIELCNLAQDEGCYKIILDCSVGNLANFYAKLGYKESELCVRKNL